MRFLVVLAGIIVYLNSFRGVFLFDDEYAISNNPYVRELWPLTRALSAPPQSPVAGRPIVSLSLAVNYALGGLDPWGYHLFNLAVHVAAGLVLLGIVERTLLSPPLKERYGAVARPLAGVVALLWVVHPLQTESVTYVVQRAESMAGFFYLATLYCAIRGFQAARPQPWHVAAVASCALGMATKEVMVTAPLLVLLYDRVFVAGSYREIGSRRAGFYASLAATWLVLGLLMMVGPRSMTAGFGLRYLTPLDYAKTQPEVILHYLRLCIWPRRLCLDYAWPVATGVSKVVVPAVVVAFLVGLAVWRFCRAEPVGYLGAWFFLVLAPTSSIVPIKDRAFEHRMYLPLAAVVALVVAVTYRLLPAAFDRRRWSSGRRRAAMVSVATAAAVLLGQATYRRNAAYFSAEAMWRDVIATRPNNARAQCGLAFALASQDRLQEALDHYGLSLRSDPDDPITHNNIGGALAKLGRYDEAVEHFAAAVRINPRFVIAQVSLGNALRLKGDLEGAVSAHRKAIEMDAAHGDAYYNLGLDLEAEGKVKEAVDAYLEALRRHPTHKGAKAALDAALAKRGAP
jgi:tetratricopeptide (TPR) repeat protein